MKILVTGSEGFVGKNLRAELENRGYEDIFCYDRETDEDLLDKYIKENKNSQYDDKHVESSCIFAQKESNIKELVFSLTPREEEILILISLGKSHHSIASELYISPSTVKTHIYNIFQKIHVTNRIQAALWAVRYLQVDNQIDAE